MKTSKILTFVITIVIYDPIHCAPILNAIALTGNFQQMPQLGSLLSNLMPRLLNDKIAKAEEPFAVGSENLVTFPESTTLHMEMNTESDPKESTDEDVQIPNFPSELFESDNGNIQGKLAALNFMKQLLRRQNPETETLTDDGPLDLVKSTPEALQGSLEDETDKRNELSILSNFRRKLSLEDFNAFFKQNFGKIEQERMPEEVKNDTEKEMNTTSPIIHMRRMRVIVAP